MRRIKNKLHNRRGASILLALLLTLVAAMICAVIISAAVTSAARVHDDRGEQQDVLAIGSAARLTAGCFDGASYTHTNVTVTTDGVAGTPATTRAYGNDVLSDLIESLVNDEATGLKNSSADAVYTITIQPTGENARSELKPVKFSFKLIPNPSQPDTWSIKGTFTFLDSTISEDMQQKLYLRGTLTHDEDKDEDWDYPWWPDPTNIDPSTGQPVQVQHAVCTETVIQTWTLEKNPQIANEESRLWDD